MCALNATLFDLSKKLPVSVKELYATHKLFSSICICIVICIFVDYREWRRRRCTKENDILNHFQSYWWRVDMDFCSIILLCLEVYCWDQWHTFQCCLINKRRKQCIILTSTDAQKALPLKMNRDIQQWVYLIDYAQIFTVIFSSSLFIL